MQYNVLTVKLYYELLSTEIMKNIPRIGKERREIIISTYISVLGIIKVKLSDIREYGSIGYEIFTNTYNEYKFLSMKMYKNMILEPWILIPLNNSLDILNYPSCLYQGTDDYSTFSLCLIIFMSLYDLQAKMTNKPSISEEFPIPFEGKEMEIGYKMGINGKITLIILL